MYLLVRVIVNSCNTGSDLKNCLKVLDEGATEGKEASDTQPAHFQVDQTFEVRGVGSGGSPLAFKYSRDSSSYLPALRTVHIQVIETPTILELTENHCHGLLGLPFTTEGPRTYCQNRGFSGV